MQGDLHRIGSVSVWGVSRLDRRRGAGRHGSAASADCASPMLRQTVPTVWRAPWRARGVHRQASHGAGIGLCPTADLELLGDQGGQQ
jgi:hypothetical protein